MKRNLYVVPFFGVGRRVTLDVDFRYRSLGESICEDRKIISVDLDWHDNPFRDFHKLVDQWASSMLLVAKAARENGYHLEDSLLTLDGLIEELKSVRWLYDVGYGEREAAVPAFLKLLASCNVRCDR